MKRYGFFKVAGAIPTVGVADCRGNSSRIEALIRQADRQGVELVAFPELSLTGATCGDLFLQPTLQQAAREALTELVRRTADCHVASLVGLPLRVGGRLYNCAVAFGGGSILGVIPKSHIPNHGAHSEGRYFASGADLRGTVLEIEGEEVPFGCDLLLSINGVECGVEIGEDLWTPCPPSTHQTMAGARLLVNLSATPEQVGKHDYLQTLVCQQAARLHSGYLYVGAGFGESSTDLVFSGEALISEAGTLLAQSERFSLQEQLITAEVDVEQLLNERQRTSTLPASEEEYTLCTYNFTPNEAPFERFIDPLPFVPSDSQKRAERCEEIFQIQALALAKRLTHTGCKRAVIGISGGLDSTLALLVTVKTFDRLGFDRKGIYGITMPGFGTTDRTYQNALDLMHELGISQDEISIVPAVKQHFSDIGLADDDRSATYENSQARERTQILMDYANKVGGLVIGTGDLSELALGWATYNGDHMSMYGINGAIPKTLVRYLVRQVAEQLGGRVGATLLDIVDTPVSPELLPADEQGKIAQKTEDLVGPYELHDFFLYHFIRRGATPRKLLFLAQAAFREHYSREVILHWMQTFFRRFFNQQFKRSALPDGPKVGSVGLSPRGDWRMPSDASSALWLAEVEALMHEKA